MNVLLALATVVLVFAPSHPLWSDGASKRRWIELPPDAWIDASEPDTWRFPVGTKLFKEFRQGGAPVETRVIERTASGWRYATYVWNAQGTEAKLAPEDGVVLPVPAAPGGRYEVPSRNDCVVCHEGPKVPVLGFSRAQLEADIPALEALGVLRNTRAMKEAPLPRAANATEHAALGYLHGNCGHCHNASALEGVEMRFARTSATDPAEARQTVKQRAEKILRRMRSTDPVVRMPPIGTRAVDAEGVALVERWIAELKSNLEESP